MIDKRLCRFIPDAFEPVNIKDFLSADSTYITIQMSSVDVKESELEKIKKYELDILIKIGLNQCNENLAKVACFGIWSFYEFEDKQTNGDPAGIREVLQSSTETEVILQATVKNHNKAIILHKTSFSTDSFSINRNRNHYYWKALSIIPKKNQELHELGEELFFEKVNTLNEHPNFKSKNEYSTPTNKEVIELTETTYEEKVIDSIYPEWDDQIIATHTLNSSDKLTVIDALSRRKI